ncbi:MAG: hypothetical protein RL662_36 [Bacteroidota bacterium]|jgi:phosphate/sulfate permease
MSENELGNDQILSVNTTNTDNQVTNKEQRIADQNLSMAIVAGIITSILCIVLWTTITVLTKYQISYMAIGVGVAVGFSIQKFGKGQTYAYGVLGGVLALFACIMGNLFSYVCLFANDYPDYTYWEAFSQLDIEISNHIMKLRFQIIDLLFYGIAIYCGFMFSIQKDEQ